VRVYPLWSQKKKIPPNSTRPQARADHIIHEGEDRKKSKAGRGGGVSFGRVVREPDTTYQHARGQSVKMSRRDINLF